MFIDIIIDFKNGYYEEFLVDGGDNKIIIR